MGPCFPLRDGKEVFCGRQQAVCPIMHYTQSLKSPHALRGTIICMGRSGGMKSPKSPLNIPKTTVTPIKIQTDILIELSLHIMNSYSRRNIKTSIACQKKGVIFPKSQWDAVCMSVKWVGDAVNQQLLLFKSNDPPNDPPNRTTPEIILFQRWVVPALATTASCENKSHDKCRCVNAIEPANTSPNITNEYQLMS